METLGRNSKSGKANGKGETKYGKRVLGVQESDKLDVNFVLEAVNG